MKTTPIVTVLATTALSFASPLPKSGPVSVEPIPEPNNNPNALSTPGQVMPSSVPKSGPHFPLPKDEINTISSLDEFFPPFYGNSQTETPRKRNKRQLVDPVTSPAVTDVPPNIWDILKDYIVPPLIPIHEDLPPVVQDEQTEPLGKRNMTTTHIPREAKYLTPHRLNETDDNGTDPNVEHVDSRPICNGKPCTPEENILDWLQRVQNDIGKYLQNPNVEHVDSHSDLCNGEPCAISNPYLIGLLHNSANDDKEATDPSVEHADSRPNCNGRPCTPEDYPTDPLSFPLDDLKKSLDTDPIVEDTIETLKKLRDMIDNLNDTFTYQPLDRPNIPNKHRPFPPRPRLLPEIPSKREIPTMTSDSTSTATTLTPVYTPTPVVYVYPLPSLHPFTTTNKTQPLPWRQSPRANPRHQSTNVQDVFMDSRTCYRSLSSATGPA